MILDWKIQNKGKCVICCKETPKRGSILCTICEEEYETTDLKIKKRLTELGYL